MRYIALLRGINVSGQKRIKMADLINTFEAMGLSNVKTYVQSGNVIFDYEPTDMMALSVQIEKKIDEVFGFPVKIIIRTQDELSKIINNNPFIKEPGVEPDKLHVTFLMNRPESDKISRLDIKKDENEKFIIIEREVYIYCPNGYGNTKLNNTTFEKKLNVTATTRNWKTVNSLMD